MTLLPFHLAIEVKDLDSSRHFYGKLLGCAEGRSDERWVDFDFFGHQLVCHVSGRYPNVAVKNSEEVHESNQVDGHEVPVPHFGAILSLDVWKTVAHALRAADIPFIIEPYIRFEGQPGEQATMFCFDPSGNALEFKAFVDLGKLFSKA